MQLARLHSWDENLEASFREYSEVVFGMSLLVPLVVKSNMRFQRWELFFVLGDFDSNYVKRQDESPFFFCWSSPGV